MEAMIAFRKIYYWFFIVWLAFKWIFRTSLGDWVWYEGKKYLVANGVISNCWRLHGLNTFDIHKTEPGWVHRSECKKVVSFSNYLHSFKSGYTFYMQSWYQIWVFKGIEPWMRGCRIW